MPRTGENIYKRKDGRWEGRYIKSHSTEGKANYGYVYAKSYRDIKEKLAKAMVQQTALLPKQFSGDILLCDIAKDWLSKIQVQIKESSRVKYQNLLDTYILPALGHKKLCCLSYSDIDSFCSELLMTGGVRKNGLSPKTVADILSLIRTILAFAASQEYTVLCDARKIKIKQSQPPMRILSRNEQMELCAYLLQHPDNRNWGILLCLFTGLRVGELCALQWEDISFRDNTIFVHQTMQRIRASDPGTAKTKIIITNPKSASSIRTIPLPQDLADLLKEAKIEKEGFFLTGSREKYLEPRVMQNQFKRVLTRCGIEAANFHALRHTFATRCVELGFDAKSLSELLGHASVAITMNRYVHPTMELKRNNMQRLSPLIAVK